MTFPVDPTPFVLAAVNTKVTAIEGETVSVEAIGALMDGQIPLHRLYLPGRRGFFQIHLGRDGQPDECRYFSLLDEVSPASPDEWGVWLDPAQGLIGWPQFQAKDGKLYDRVWAGGSSRVPPRDLGETIQDLAGTSQRVLHAMLYARAYRGGAAGAPDRVHPGRGSGRQRPGLGRDPCRHRHQPGIVEPAGREPDVTPPFIPCAEIA